MLNMYHSFMLHLKTTADFSVLPIFFQLCEKKLNIISKIYEIPNFPYGPSVHLPTYRSAVMYWLGCTVQKTEFLLGIVTDNPPVCTHLRSCLIKLLSSWNVHLRKQSGKAMHKNFIKPTTTNFCL